VPPHMDYYKPDSEYGKKVQDLLAKYDNAFKYDPEEAALLDGKPEAQYNTQDYYSTMTNVIQEVFSKKNTDSKQLLDSAAKEMQEKYYNNIKP
jgi:hypothetical protein